LIFATSGNRLFVNFSRAKRELTRLIMDARRQAAADAGLDPKQVQAMPRWTIHDLRRTARTRMARLGTEPEIAERVINHVPGGLRATYDVHLYRAEKRAALALWADHLRGIVGPGAASSAGVTACETCESCESADS
jgi:integrase